MKLLASALFCSVVCLAAEKADLVITNGHVVTMNAAQPQAQAVAIGNGRVLAVGTNAEMTRYTALRHLKLNGELVIPGLIEGHGHFMSLGQSKMQLNLRETRNWDEIVAMVRAAAKEAKPGEWIIGSGWHQSKWDRIPQPNVHGFPLETELSKAAPNNPVWLHHASFHSSMVNAAALKAAGIDAQTPNPAGGEILKTDAGQPTGLLNETAQGLLSGAYEKYQERRTPQEREAYDLKTIQFATRECLSKGITTFEDAGSSFETVDLFKKLAASGELPLRLWVMLRVGTPEMRQRSTNYRMIDFGDSHLTVRAFKRVMDGALGSRGAWFLQPYSDLPSTSGLNTQDLDDLRAVADFAINHDFQLCVHAIGDRANRETLNIYEQVFRAHPDKTDLRWRVEHAQHLNPADIPRFGQLGVIAAMQGIHCTSDAPFVRARIGEQRAEEGAYVWRKLMDSGAVVGNGTDSPVEDVDPIACFYSTVTRKLKDGTRFYPSQCLTREEALRTYTLNNAFAAFEEKEKGSLMPGKLADVTILSKDIMRIPEDEIPSAKVLYTIVGGKIAYQQSQ
jgi:predicted amidohydrolase YtcJ